MRVARIVMSTSVNELINGDSNGMDQMAGKLLTFPDPKLSIRASALVFAAPESQKNMKNNWFESAVLMHTLQLSMGVDDRHLRSET